MNFRQTMRFAEKYHQLATPLADGEVSVRFDDGAIWLGGHAVTCVKGSLRV
jgi:hypothetical protein